MADNIIRVNVTSNKTQRVSVTPGQVQNEIIARPDTSQYYSNLSKNWAISETIVNNEDYSSKHYAQEAKESAQNASNFENATRETYNSFLETSANAVIEIQGVKEETLTEIDNSKTNAVDSINTVKNNAVDSINSTKTTILNDIEFVADGEKKEIEDLIDIGKDEIKESIGDVKVLTTLEIGDIGIAPLGIDETKGKRRYLNGQLIIQEQYVEFTNKVKSAVALYPSLACTEKEWQTAVTMSVFGSCGKFVVDNTAGTIRLPKINGFIQGLTNLSSLANIVNAGLPNITGKASSAGGSSGFTTGMTGAFWAPTVTQKVHVTGTNNYASCEELNLDASRSNAIYGKSNTVQPEAIKYPYFIQVATGAEIEDNIINEIELNNPFSLLDYKYSEYQLNNVSWLRSNGQFNSKAVYPAVYDLLLKIYNGTETKAGVSVKLSTASYTDTDFVLNTAEETFRLPKKVKLASGKAVKGNGKTLGLTNGTTNYGLYGGTDYGTFIASNLYNTNVGATGTASSGSEKALGVTTDASKSGLELSDSGLYLYFYVGETVQNANLINAGRIEEKVSEKVNRSEFSEVVVITQTYVKGKSGYIIYSNKYCEQWGYLLPTSSASVHTVTFLKPFKDTNYSILRTTVSASDTSSTSLRAVTTQALTTTNFKMYLPTPTYADGAMWRACGYIA